MKAGIGTFSAAALILCTSDMVLAQASPEAGKPHSTTPITNPATWIKRDDAPRVARQLHVKGTLRFMLLVDREGKVTDCLVQQTTGNPDLDLASCDALKRRARFIPATDESGAPTSGSYRSLINWDL